jgi:hypothetical protein
MKFLTSDENDIHWLRNVSDYEVADTVRRIKDTGKWDEFLAIEADENGVVDCDALYDRLRHESREALASVGLHETDATSTPLAVIAAWAKDNPDMRVSYLADGKTPSGLQLYDYGCSGIGTCLEFEAADEDGEVEEVSLDADEVLELVKGEAGCAVNNGKWNGTDVNSAVFEMWEE